MLAVCKGSAGSSSLDRDTPHGVGCMGGCGFPRLRRMLPSWPLQPWLLLKLQGTKSGCT